VAPEVFVWIVLGALANLPLAGSEPQVAQLAVGLGGLVQAVRAYWRDGGRRISAPGMYMVASGLFVYFPAIYLYFDDPIIHGPAAFTAAVNIAFWSQLVMYFFIWEPRREQSVDLVSFDRGPLTTWGLWTGSLLVAAGVVFVRTPLSSYGLDDGAAFAGITLLAVSAFRRRGRIGIFSYLLVVAAFVVYLQFVFAGFGRLQIGALGIVLAAAAAHRWRGRIVKVALLLAFPPVLSYLAASRVAFSGALNPNQSASVTGLESAIGPFVRFAELIQFEIEGLIDHSWFHTFFAAAVALVPRQLWATKPIGFGAELADFFRPDLIGRGHSEAALFHGEWVFAFGFPGLIAMVAVVGVLVRWIDAASQRVSRSSGASRLDLLKIAALLILAASITDLIWGGAFTYVSRVGPRLMCLFAVFLIFGWRLPSQASATNLFQARAEGSAVADDAVPKAQGSAI
jgi:hypothetical protein